MKGLKGIPPILLFSSSIGGGGSIAGRLSTSSSTVSMPACRICQLPAMEPNNPLISPCRYEMAEKMVLLSSHELSLKIRTGQVERSLNLAINFFCIIHIFLGPGWVDMYLDIPSCCPPAKITLSSIWHPVEHPELESTKARSQSGWVTL